MVSVIANNLIGFDTICFRLLLSFWLLPAFAANFVERLPIVKVDIFFQLIDSAIDVEEFIS